MNAYVVTEGSYSDYNIVRVFLEKALAEEYVRVRDEDYRVEEYEVTERIPEIKTVHARNVVINADTGEVIVDASGHSDFETENVDHILGGKELRWDRIEMAEFSDLPRRVRLCVQGLDPERVKKVAGDRMAQERAQIMGL